MWFSKLLHLNVIVSEEPKAFINISAFHTLEQFPRKDYAQDWILQLMAGYHLAHILAVLVKKSHYRTSTNGSCFTVDVIFLAHTSHITASFVILHTALKQSKLFSVQPLDMRTGSMWYQICGCKWEAEGGVCWLWALENAASDWLYWPVKACELVTLRNVKNPC